MAVRPSRAVSVIAGCAALAGIAAASPAIAASDQDGDRVAVAGSTPAWATPAAKVGDTDAHAQRHIQIALSLRDQAGAEALAKAISTPGSPQFRKTLTAGQFNDRFAATQATVDQVSDWLRGQGLRVTGVSSNRHFVDVVADTGTLERAFGTQLATYRHKGKDGKIQKLVAPEKVITLPAAVRGTVTGVLGLDDSEKMSTPQNVLHPAPAAQAAGGANCATYWGQTVNTSVPQKYADQSNVLCGYNTAQTRGIYGLTSANTGAGTTIGIVGAYNGATTLADANRAAAKFGSPPIAANQYAVKLPDGGFNNDPTCEPDSWNGEQALDVQAAHTAAPAAKLTYYAAKDCRTLYDAMNRAVADNQVGIITNSWGNNGGEAGVAPTTRAQMDSIGVQAAIQGQSLMVSSGDAGDASAIAGKPTPQFPAANPWITAVGGTSVAVNSANKKQFDTGWTSSALVQSGNGYAPTQDKDGPFAGGAGGGVATTYDLPDYQTGKVSGTKRSVPDIGALADAYTGFAIGQTIPGQGYFEFNSGGTSLASPLLAGMVANAAQAAGTDRLGFLNPAIYSLAGTAAISDVTHHSTGVWTNFVGGYGGVTTPTTQGSYLIDFDQKPQTLQSGPGWDPLTGVGTPAPGFVAALGK
ncbi:S53 family peptidase [Amycolatopsis saalfeldensis]|uniref:Subtilase family protein n=1 Tax=Amycolatopsis saalfeldensis TaxID=394193 RepID=A0A1H8YR70_9PSEU|nr:S53 family serine peptidase [Amycolatopsis saalfeldensis]SEP54501.1 Subtilase family protein [Amycolatopsis saalfeldensis]